MIHRHFARQSAVLMAVALAIQAGVSANATNVMLTGVPYIHQLYDSPDSFPGGGSCCNATATLMAIQYYGKLPAYPITCTRGGTHISNFGFYISSIYTFNGTIFNRVSSAVWGSSLAGYYGGFGYFLQDAHGDSLQRSTRLSEFIAAHGLQSGTDDDVAGDIGMAKVRAEIDAGYPVVILNGLTSAGHYITCVGYVKNQNTFIFNDPYGNKAISYPGWAGANVLYDWPGSANGHPNLNTVYRFVYVRGAARIISLSGSLAFGNVIVGTSAQRQLTISNLGNSPLTVSNFALPSGFAANWSGVIPPAGAQNVTITFCPTSLATQTGSVSVGSDANNGTNSVAISGAGAPLPTLQISRSGTSITLTWPTNAAGFTLQSAPSCTVGGWTPVSSPPVSQGTNYILTTTNSASMMFYRLSYPSH